MWHIRIAYRPNKTNAICVIGNNIGIYFKPKTAFSTRIKIDFLMYHRQNRKLKI